MPTLKEHKGRRWHNNKNCVVGEIFSTQSFDGQATVKARFPWVLGGTVDSRERFRRGIGLSARWFCCVLCTVYIVGGLMLY